MQRGAAQGQSVCEVFGSVVKMTKTSVSQDNLLATIIDRPELILTLWVIGIGLCKSVRDFDDHFGTEFPAQTYIDALVSLGCIVQRGRNLEVTNLAAAILPR